MSSTTPCSEVDPSWASVGCGSVRLSRTKSAAQRWRRRVENCMARIPQSGDVPIAVQPSYTYRRVEARQSVIGTSRKAKTKKGKHCTFVFERDSSQNQNGTCCWAAALNSIRSFPVEPISRYPRATRLICIGRARARKRNTITSSWTCSPESPQSSLSIASAHGRLCRSRRWSFSSEGPQRCAFMDLVDF